MWRLPRWLPAEEELNSYLKTSGGEYGEKKLSVPLGDDAGIPSVAATCDAAKVLEYWAP